MSCRVSWPACDFYISNLCTDCQVNTEAFRRESNMTHSCTRLSADKYYFLYWYNQYIGASPEPVFPIFYP
jgi:hypothetical protein